MPLDRLLSEKLGITVTVYRTPYSLVFSVLFSRIFSIPAIAQLARTVLPGLILSNRIIEEIAGRIWGGERQAAACPLSHSTTAVTATPGADPSDITIQ